MKNFLELLFEFFVSLILFVVETFSFINEWLIKILGSTLKDFSSPIDLILASLVSAIFLVIAFKLGISSARLLFVLLIMCLALIILIIIF
jgi:hypothetical protein